MHQVVAVWIILPAVLSVVECKKSELISVNFVGGLLFGVFMIVGSNMFIGMFGGW